MHLYIILKTDELMEDIEKIISEKVLTERLRQMADDHLIERSECYGYPPRVEYRVTGRDSL